MRLKQKTIIIVTISFLILLTFLGLVVRFSVLHEFETLENTSVTDSTLQVKSQILDETDDLNAIVGDWAEWTDTRDYAIGDYPEYIADNMMDSSFTNLSLNSMWIADASGHELFAKTVDLASGTEIPFSEDLRTAVATHPQMTHFSTITDSTSGMIAMPDGIVLFAAQPILDSFGEGPIAGTIIMAENMDDRWMQELAETTQLPVKLLRWDDPALSPMAQAARTDFAQGQSLLAQVLDDDTVAGFARIDDIDGRPVALLEVTQPRTLYKAGLRSLGWMFTIMTIIAIVMVFVMVILLDRQVLRRVSGLDEHLTTITRSGDLETRLVAKQNDELSRLTRTVNTMMDTIQASDTALREAHTNLEKRVAERTLNLSEALEEKNVLLKEVHHRVKNNMQVVSSMLYLQGRMADDTRIAAALDEGRARVQSMALIHEKLYQSENLARIDFGEYTRELVAFLEKSQCASECKININFNVQSFFLTVDTAIPAGLIVNELVTNAFKHAFDGREIGSLWVDMACDEDMVTMRIRDDGVGLPVDFEASQRNSLGMELVNSLTKQLRGNLEVANENGATFQVTFPQD